MWLGFGLTDVMTPFIILGGVDLQMNCISIS